MSIKIENTQVFGWEAAIRGARNPMNSWEKSDSWIYSHMDTDDIDNFQKMIPEGINYISEDQLLDWYEEQYGDSSKYYENNSHTYIGPNDHKLLMNLCKGGTEESKWRRMVHVQMDVTAPLYWWKEFETYKVGTVSNSCSTMHKIHAKEFTLEDFSCEHLCHTSVVYLEESIGTLNFYREVYNSFDEKSSDQNWFKSFVEDYGLQTKKDIWWQMIQLLPSSYNQRRTIDLNYEVLAAQYRQRKDHKLDCWHQYCDWIKTLPYSEFITMEDDNGVKIPTLTIEDIKLLRPKYEDFRKSVVVGIIPVNKEVSNWMNTMDAIIEEADRITAEE